MSSSGHGEQAPPSPEQAIYQGYLLHYANGAACCPKQSG